MSDRLGVGLFLPASLPHLELIEPLLSRADFFELSPENFLAGQKPDGSFAWRACLQDMQEIKTRYGKPFVAHGLQFSMGTALTQDKHEELWLGLVRHFHQLFDFAWYTDHLGFSVSPSGLNALLPLPLPHTQEAVQTVAARLRRLSQVVPVVGFENSVFYFTLGDPMEEADLYNRICAEADCRLLLDTHNIYTHCRNFELDPRDFLQRIDLSRVVEIHVSGGSESEPAWMEGPTYRLDSHDGPVPETVWELLEELLPCCPNLRGATLERLEGTVEPEQVPQLAGELERLRELWEGLVVSGA